MPVPLRIQKVLFKKIEDNGGILKYHNKSGCNEQILKKYLMNLVCCLGKKGSKCELMQVDVSDIGTNATAMTRMQSYI